MVGRLLSLAQPQLYWPLWKPEKPCNPNSLGCRLLVAGYTPAGKLFHPLLCEMAAGVNVRDIPSQVFIAELAAHFKKSGKLQVPGWVDIVKTGASRELPPSDPDWFYVRTAAIARQIYVHGSVGVGRLARVYGGRINRGHRPSRHADGSRNIIRRALQGLESMGLLERHSVNGRKISASGQRDLDRVALHCRSKCDIAVIAA